MAYVSYSDYEEVLIQDRGDPDLLILLALYIAED